MVDEAIKEGVRVTTGQDIEKKEKEGTVQEIEVDKVRYKTFVTYMTLGINIVPGITTE